MKTTWQRIDSLIRPSRAIPKVKLKVKDELPTFLIEIASSFNSHFSSLAQVLNAKFA